MNIPDLIFENLVSIFGLKIFKLFDADPGSCQFWIRDGKIGSGIRDRHPGSATRGKTLIYEKKITAPHRRTRLLAKMFLQDLFLSFSSLLTYR
jgi:hypothetical protein